jgi:hypothetical protein
LPETVKRATELLENKALTDEAVFEACTKLQKFFADFPTKKDTEQTSIIAEGFGQLAAAMKEGCDEKVRRGPAGACNDPINKRQLLSDPFSPRPHTEPPRPSDPRQVQRADPRIGELEHFGEVYLTWFRS